jgi:S-formylglutathione hydrolase FrmB
MSSGGACTNEMSVDGLDVFAEVSSFAGMADLTNVLGFAAPITLENSGKTRVRQAIMVFDSDKFPNLSRENRVEVMVHELG